MVIILYYYTKSDNRTSLRCWHGPKPSQQQTISAVDADQFDDSVEFDESASSATCRTGARAHARRIELKCRIEFDRQIELSHCIESFN